MFSLFWARDSASEKNRGFTIQVEIVMLCSFVIEDPEDGGSKAL
jgi:hypothetical protein